MGWVTWGGVINQKIKYVGQIYIFYLSLIIIIIINHINISVVSYYHFSAGSIGLSSDSDGVACGYFYTYFF